MKETPGQQFRLCSLAWFSNADGQRSANQLCFLFGHCASQLICSAHEDGPCSGIKNLFKTINIKHMDDQAICLKLIEFQDNSDMHRSV